MHRRIERPRSRRETEEGNPPCLKRKKKREKGSGIKRAGEW